jgi:CRP-like cAMP-binding protein
MAGTLNVTLSFNSNGDTRLSRPGDQQATTKSFSYGPGDLVCFHQVLHMSAQQPCSRQLARVVDRSDQVSAGFHGCACAGTILGQTDLWLHRPRAGTAVAGSEPCTLFVVSRAAFDTLRLKSPEVHTCAANGACLCTVSASHLSMQTQLVHHL